MLLHVQQISKEKQIEPKQNRIVQRPPNLLPDLVPRLIVKAVLEPSTSPAKMVVFFSRQIRYSIFIIIRWCFFLSSVFTFVAGVASVLIIRALNSVFRKKVKLRKIDENTLISIG